MALEVEVVSDKEQLWFGQANLCWSNDRWGSVGILSGHQPMLATVVEGIVEIKTFDGEKVEIEVGSGILS